MLFSNLLAESSSASSGTSNSGNGWLTLVVFGVLIVFLIVTSFLRNKKERKTYEEKMAKMDIGAKVRTIGLIVGEIVDMDETTVTLKTGTKNNFSFVTVEKRAVYEVVSPEESDEKKAPVDDVYQAETDPEPETPEVTDTAENLTDENKETDEAEVKIEA